MARVRLPKQETKIARPVALDMTVPTPHFRVIPLRQNAHPDEVAGAHYVVVSRQSPWEPGAYRLVIPADQDPGWRIGQPRPGRGR
jgi:hypothetical protein